LKRQRLLNNLIFSLSLILFATELIAATENINIAPQTVTHSTHWRFLVPYRANYLVFLDGKQVGSSERILSKEQDHWRLSSKAKASRYLFSIRSFESSQFKINNTRVTPLVYESTRKVTLQKSRNVTQEFDWTTLLEKGKNRKRQWEIKITEDTLDRLSHTLQIRADMFLGRKNLTYRVSYNGKIRNYQYTIEGAEDLHLMGRQLKTIKLNRKKSETESFSLWLAPELNYIPVKIGQYEQGEDSLELVLSAIDYHPVNAPTP